MRHKFLVLTVKKWLKSVYIYGSYRKIKTGVPLFLDHSVHALSMRWLAKEYTTISGNVGISVAVKSAIDIACHLSILCSSLSLLHGLCMCMCVHPYVN